MQVLGHSLVRLLICSHRSLIRLLHPACMLRCAHLFARSLTSLTPSLLGQWLIRWLFYLCFFLFWTIVHRRVRGRESNKRKHNLLWPFPFVSFFSLSILHYGPEQSRIQTQKLCHLLVRWLVCLHRSLTGLFRPACFACTLHSTHLFICSLTHSLPNSWESKLLDDRESGCSGT